MVLGSHARGVQHTLFSPIASVLVRWGVSPNTVTVVGTIITTALALTLIPMGHLIVGSLLIAIMALMDSIDGIMARQAGTVGPYGAFLDSTLDRVSDAAIFAGVMWWFFLHTDGVWQLVGMASAIACLAFGSMVSYARAKAESLGVEAAGGIAERADRILVVLVAVFATGFGLTPVVMAILLALLALLSSVTVLQRIATVHSALRTDDQLNRDSSDL